MRQRQPSGRKVQAVSLALILISAAIVTASDYWTTLNSVMSQSEEYAHRVAAHLSRTLITQGNAGGGSIDLASPDSFRSHRARVENVIEGFGLENIKIFNRDGVVLFSLDTSVIGKVARNNRSLALAIEGTGSSHVATQAYQVRTYGKGSGSSMLETYVPIVDPDDGKIHGVYEIYQDFRPLKKEVLSETVRASAAHIFLFLVFAALFYRYGRVTSRSYQLRTETLIRELEERVDERTMELQRSRDRIEELLSRKDEMFRELMIADEYKKNFMGLVSHELRTPLAVIQGYLSLLQDGEMDPGNENGKEAIRSCLIESGKLEAIINNILELSQLERGVYDITAEEFALGELINEAIEAVEPEIGGKVLSFSVTVDEKVQRFATDRLKLLQVMQQLISNAVKFSRDRGNITVDAAESHRGLLIAVTDEGVGIPEAQVDEIFSLFYQVDISTTRSYEGSGLGLAIVRSITQILGGRVWVKSREGKGSTFFCEIPTLSRSRAVTDTAGALGGGVHSGEEVPHTPERSRSVLVIDDDQEFLYFIRRILVEGGYAVEICRDGLEGLNRLFGPDHPQLPSLILLDVRMPHINGIDVLRIIRRSMMARGIPVIIVSALGQEKQVREGIEAGANAYFVKPFDHHALMARIGFLLGERGNEETGSHL